MPRLSNVMYPFSYRLRPGLKTSRTAFRQMLMEDLDLHREIKFAPGSNGSHFKQTQRASVRCIYSGRVCGCKATMTVALYRGENTENEWRPEVSRCSWLRLISAIQIFFNSLVPPVHVVYIPPYFTMVHIYAGTNLSLGTRICVSGVELASVDLGSIYFCTSGSRFQDVLNVASIRGPAYQDSGWLPELSQLEHNLVEVGGGWVRLESEHVEQIEEIFRKIYCGASEFAFWLTQANHIFNHLRITTGQDDYGLSILFFVHSIEYQLMISGAANIPQGYLFLCPLTGLQSGLPTRMCLPACPAYWSLEPSGAQSLSTDEAERLGFPTINLVMEVQGMYMVGSLYSGLCQLYQGKGFDAYSQDVAQKLGYPLYQVSEQFISRVEDQDDPCGDNSSESASSETEGIIAPDDADLYPGTELVPSMGWNIVMSVQLALMLTLVML
ncbi:hypothetical protein B0H14DRAFT_2558224 [Mycena olivaceomarginata]|nr:hypothetical protein B0H14DRAFT_2558224 [Mycena olivaceomarginata]